jgi:hypothetical protein
MAAVTASSKRHIVLKKGKKFVVADYQSRLARIKAK